MAKEFHQHTEEKYKKDLQGNIVRFEHAFSGYSSTSNYTEKAHCTDIMKQQMALIKANAQEVKITGIQKQSEIASSAFEKFAKDPTEENRTTLLQVMSTLKEYGLLS